MSVKYGMNEKALTASKLILSHIMLPLCVCSILFLIQTPTLNSLIIFLIAQSLLVIVYCAGYWEFWGLSFRTAFLAMLELAILYRFFSLAGAFFVAVDILTVVLLFVELLLATEIARILIVLTRKEKETIEISFPFRSGTYLITDGGNSKISRLMNYHYYSPMHKKKGTNLSMLHATDIVKLENQKGATGFLPPRNEDYYTWGEELNCPMDGAVVKVVNDIPDNTPFCGTYPYNAGNIVVIQRNDHFLLLGHLQQGSISVSEGQIVAENQIIARAGNSGLSERPHLHMQLMRSPTANYWSGTGVSIQFREKNLFKNRRIAI